MRILIALGGNALLRRNQPATLALQMENARIAARALAPLASEHHLLITHGNGPQVGLLALQSDAVGATQAQPLDLLDAETEGMIGYWLAQELQNVLPQGRQIITLLTRIEVCPGDPALSLPSKPIGPVYHETEARNLAAKRGWSVAPDGTHWRRVVPSPRPQRILELEAIRLLTENNMLVICAGGGGIPVMRGEDGNLRGVEAVIDKDHASGLLARELQADALLMLTDVDAVHDNWGRPSTRAISRASVAALRERSFAAGSMGPKVTAACEFVEQASGIAGIGNLEDAVGILDGNCGTLITPTIDRIHYRN